MAGGTTRPIATVNTGAVRATVTQQSSAVLDQTQQLLATSETTELHLRTTHRFNVDGRANAVNYGQQTGAPAADRAAFTLGMEPGAQYTINAEGAINKGGSNVSPTDGQRGAPDRTRLQIQVRHNGQLVDSLNYTPGMTVDSSRYPPGSTLSGVFVDGRNRGEINDNSGQFRVRIDQHEVRASTTNNTVIAGDRVDRPVVPATPTTVPPATVPPPSTNQSGPGERALTQNGGTIRTSGGYELIQNGDSGLMIQAPRGEDGRSNHTYFDFRNNVIRESDGTQLALTANMKNGTYNLPDGTQLRFRTNEQGAITGYDIASHEQRASATFANGQAQTTMSNDGREWRIRNNEDPNAFHFHQVGLGADAARIGDVATKQQIGWYATQGQQSYGWLEGARDRDGNLVNFAVPQMPAIVNRDLQPRIGTAGYEHALVNELDNNLAATSGHIQAYGRAIGREVDPTQARLAALEYIRPQKENYAQASAWNQFVQQNPGAADWFGGMGGHFSSLPQGLQSTLLMYQLMAWQQSLALPAPSTYWA